MCTCCTFKCLVLGPNSHQSTTLYILDPRYWYAVDEDDDDEDDGVDEDGDDGDECLCAC